MLNFIAQAGYAATTIDFTSDFSLLLSGLVGVTWFAAGMIVAAAVHEWRSQATFTHDEVAFPMPTATMQQHAA
jgi:hypothetical protein